VSELLIVGYETTPEQIDSSQSSPHITDTDSGPNSADVEGLRLKSVSTAPPKGDARPIPPFRCETRNYGCQYVRVLANT